MLYIAIAMILVGVLCFVYVSMAPQNSEKSKSSGNDSKERYNASPVEERSPGLSPRRRHNLTEEEYIESVNYARPSQRHPEEDERFLRERDLRFSPPPRNFDSESDDASSILERSNTIYTKPTPIDDTPEIVDSVKILGREGESLEPAPEEKLIVQGLVYLDSKGKLPLDKRDFPERELSEEFFQEIRRIGDGALFEEGGRLTFRVKNLSYTFEARDLKQVVFYDEAVVFLPHRTDYSTVIFFTNEPDAIKAFFAQAEAKLV